MRCWSVGQVQGRLGVFEEDVGVVLGAWSKSRKPRAESSCAALTSAGRPWAAARRRRPESSLGQEDGDAGDQQGARQLLDDGVEQGLEIGFGTEAAAEFDQRLAVVVAMAVKGAVDPALNAALEGVEDGGRDQDGDDQAPLAHRFGQRGVHHHGDERDDAEVAAQDQAGGQRVGHAALEDQVGVHQPVADDGPTEGERQKDQRQAGQLGEQAGRIEVKEEGDGVKQREGQQPRAACRG